MSPLETESVACDNSILVNKLMSCLTQTTDNCSKLSMIETSLATHLAQANFEQHRHLKFVHRLYMQSQSFQLFQFHYYVILAENIKEKA